MLAGYSRINGWRRARILIYIAFAVFSFFYGAIFAIGGVYVLNWLIIPLAVIGVLIVWIYPETGLTFHRAISLLLLAYIFALLVWPDYIALAIKGLPWITAARATSTPLLIIFLLALSQSRATRAEIKEILARTRWLTISVVAFAIICALSTAFSSQFGFTFGRVVRAEIGWTLTFFAAVYCFSRAGWATAMAYTLWIVAVIASLIAVWEQRLGHVPWLGNIPSIFQVDPEMLERLVAPKVRTLSGAFRVQAAQTTPLGLAELLAMCIPFVIHIIMTARSVLVRVLASASVPLIIWTVVQTDARLGTTGLLLTALLFPLALAARRWYRDRLSVVGPLTVMAYPAVFAAVLTGTFFVRRLRNLVWGDGSARTSTEARAEQWAAGIPEFLGQPWGHGLGRGADVLGWSASSTSTISIDSYYLSILLELGIIGLFIFAAMLVSAIIYGAIGAVKADGPETKLLVPITITLANFTLIKAVLSQDANHPMIFVLLGMLAALVWRLDREKAADSAAVFAGEGDQGRDLALR